MSKLSQEIENEIDDLVNQEIEPDDYVFIVSADGELKSVLLPDTVPFKTPKNIAKILKMFGIYDVEGLNKDVTIH